MTIFFPTSTKKLSDLPTLAVDPTTNANNIDIIVLQNSNGQTFRVPLKSLGVYLSLSYDSMLAPSQTQIILGRYSPGPGPLQEIKIGDNITLNSDTGLLDCSLTLVGEAGGVLFGDFPAPDLRENVIEAKHITSIKPNTIIGRASKEEGPPEEITLGPEFELDEETRTIRVLNTSNRLVDTGFTTEKKKDGTDFNAVPTKIYFVESELDITIDAAALENWRAGEQFMVINIGVGEVNVTLPNGDYIAMNETEIDSIHLMADGDGGYIIL